jgi:PAS domain S-box-containing protein
MPDLSVAFAKQPTATAVLDLSDLSELVVCAANEAFCALTGRSAAELAGMPASRLIVGPEKLAAVLGACGETRRTEAWCVDAGGRHVPVLIDAVTSEELPSRSIVQLHEQRHGVDSELAVRSSEKRLQEIADNVTALIYIKRTDGRYMFVNRHYESIIGADRDDIQGKTDVDLWPGEIADAYRSADRQVLAARQPMEFEEPIPAEGGWGMWLSLKFPLFDADGTLYGVGGISTDISDRNRAEAAIREARDEAERANRAKSEFLSRMSHELRTPLNSILGFGQLLQLEQLPPRAAEEIDRIVSAGRHLLALINEVLDIVRIEAGVQALSVEPVHACDPIEEAFDLVRPLAASRGVELARDLHTALYRYVRADYQRLKQVLLNVLMNAVKYNRPDGIVTVYSELHGGNLRILVADTGIGIDPGDIDKVFLPFERLDAGQHDAEGTGLGLALSKSLIESMGGRIGVERSVVGRGTVFFVDLPLTGPPDAQPPPAGPPAGAPERPQVDLSGLTVLYIEDNLDNFEVVRRILARAGEPALMPAIQGHLGVELATLHGPDLILLDLHLPDIEGEDVLRQLHADARTRGVPVVVLSADATPAQRDRMMALGACSYVTKPIEINSFLGALQQAVTTKEP